MLGLWDLATGTSLVALTARAPINGVAFSREGSLLATAGSDGFVRLWDPATGDNPTALSTDRAAVWTVAFSPTGVYLATGGSDGKVRLWNVATLAEVAILTGHTGSVRAVAFSPDGSRLATAGQDGTVRITDISGQGIAARRSRRWPLSSILHPVDPQPFTLGAPVNGPTDEVVSLAYSPDGRLIASGHVNGYISLRKITPGSPRAITRPVGLPDSGWAVLYGERRYRLHGDPRGRFWWAAGVCRFEPGEVDRYGVERLP
jgi:WD40 repeat protein